MLISMSLRMSFSSEVNMHKIFVICCLLIFSTNAYSQWYEANGHAFIYNGNSKAAKTKAIENALKKALLVAGASVSSVQQVVDGLLLQDDLNIRASGTVHSFELIDEVYQDDNVTVTIRADIMSDDKKCFSADYRKSLLITKSHLQNREQANIGGIYALDSMVMKQLSNKINQNGHYLNTVLALKNKTNFSRLNSSIQADKIKNLTMSLSDVTDTQFIMFSEIQDISFNRNANNNWQFWQEDIRNRHFILEVYIYNGANGELVFNKQYRNFAPWTYSKRDMVDINSANFWQSEYGSTIMHTLDDMILDLDSTMMCQPTRGKIIQVNGNSITVNLGKEHGVKVGDEFSLLHLNNFKSDSGKTYSGFNINPNKVKVTSVYQQSAIAKTIEENLLDNIQLNDVAVRY